MMDTGNCTPGESAVHFYCLENQTMQCDARCSSLFIFVNIKVALTVLYTQCSYFLIFPLFFSSVGMVKAALEAINGLNLFGNKVIFSTIGPIFYHVFFGSLFAL